MVHSLPQVKLYGAAHCHKTEYYKTVLAKLKVPFDFLDVEANTKYAEELRGLYESGKLNFPTITIGEKKLRNPTEKELLKWLKRLYSR